AGHTGHSSTVEAVALSHRIRALLAQLAVDQPALDAVVGQGQQFGRGHPPGGSRTRHRHPSSQLRWGSHHDYTKVTAHATTRAQGSPSPPGRLAAAAGATYIRAERPLLLRTARL